MVEGVPGFGEPDVGEGVGGVHGDAEGAGVGETDVLGGEHDHASGDELGVLAGFDHEL